MRAAAVWGGEQHAAFHAFTPNAHVPPHAHAGLALGSLASLGRIKGVDGSGRSLLDFAVSMATDRGEQVLFIHCIVRDAAAVAA